MKLRDLSLADALEVVGRMRAMDRRCIEALVGDVDDEQFAADRFLTYGAAWTITDDAGLPWVIGGIALPNGWTGVLWMVVAEGMPLQSWRKVVQHTLRILSNALDPENPQGRHRVEAHVLEDWPQAQDLMRRVGMQFEGTRRRAGRSGEDIQIWAKTRPPA